MTKVQRADALLWAARWWQQEQCCSAHGGITKKTATRKVAPHYNDVSEVLLSIYAEYGLRGWLIWASAALSEVGALGFELEDVEVWDSESKIWRKT